MKNVTKNPDELKSLQKRLMKDVPAQPHKTLEALDALVRGAMSYDMADSRADEAVKVIRREFVDLNELRVATDLEIQEMLGAQYPAIEKRVALITLSLNYIFEREHTMSLDRLKTVSKRDARQFLRDLPEINPFVEAYVMLMAFDAPAMPLDDLMLAALRNAGVLGNGISLEEAQRFIEHHLKAEEIRDFYVALRRYAEGDGAMKKKK